MVLCLSPLCRLVPKAQAEVNPFILLATTRKGGHLAFLEGWWPLGSSSGWMDAAVSDFMAVAIREYMRQPDKTWSQRATDKGWVGTPIDPVLLSGVLCNCRVQVEPEVAAEQTDAVMNAVVAAAGAPAAAAGAAAVAAVGEVAGVAARAAEKGPVAGVGEVAAEVAGDVVAGVGFGVVGLGRVVGATRGAVPSGAPRPGAYGGRGRLLGGVGGLPVSAAAADGTGGGPQLMSKL